MYDWDKVLREDKSRRNTKNPSFSSSLLDEIYRSIDGSDEKFGEFKLRKPKVAKKQSVKSGGADGAAGGRGRFKSSSAVEDEEIASFRRACLVDKWMEMKGNEKVSTGRRKHTSLPEFDRKMLLDNDPMFFSSGSSSSDSSFGWYSEAEARMEAAKPKPSCFGPLNKVKTSVSPCSAVKKQNEFYLFDEDQTNKTDHSGLIRSKTRALKIYASLKKVKQPISPGGRLTSFLNALFPHGHSKKSKDSGFEDRTQIRTERKLKSTNVSTCSTASSFSRSCLSKNSPRSRDQLNNGMRRTVHFYPVSVIVDEDSRPCGQKNVWGEQDFEKLQRQKNENSNLKHIPTRHNDDEEEDDEDDMASDTSSDLFELDHLNIFKNEQYYEELPVYETTHLSTNRAIASGLIC
ncbi:hypothetical protein L1887_38733 [Cichorium endivia]|nr:hypothetical protein L1887_38733 [Cichorium endivia]